MTRTNARFLVLLAGLLITMPVAIASQAQVVKVDPVSGLVSVESDGVPLQALLEQMSAATPFALLRLEPAIHERPVHVSIRAASVKGAVSEILTAAGVGFVISGPQNGHGLRVVAARAEFIQTAASSSVKAHTAREDRDEEKEPAQIKPEDAAAETMALDDAGQTGQDRDSANRSDEQLMRAVTGTGFARQASGAVLLPFPAAGGGSMTAMVAAPGTIIELPFPGPGGAPVTAVVPARGAPVRLPFPASPPAPRATPKAESTGPKTDKL